METTIDPTRVEEFAEKLFGVYTGGMLSLLIDIGHDTGLLEAAAEGPGTSKELAARAGLDERYVREWLAAMTTGGIFTYEPSSGVYTFPAEHAVVLTGPGSMNLAPFGRIVSEFGIQTRAVADCFRKGGGVPYERFRPGFTSLMDDLNRRTYDELLVEGYVGAIPGLADRLREGISVADVGCGTGHAVNLLAREFPFSTFVGYDIAEDAIEQARAEATEWGLSNVRFEIVDVAGLPSDPSFDLICAFDAIHDQVAPDVVLRRVREALSPDGVFLMVDINTATALEDNLANPLAPFLYGVSTLHCMTVSLAHGGAGLGTCWGREKAQEMLAEAGFGQVTVEEGPEEDPVNVLYIAKP